VVQQVPAAPNIWVVKPQEVIKYIKHTKDFDLKPQVKANDNCCGHKMFKDRVIELGKETVLIEKVLGKMEIDEDKYVFTKYTK